ncbi:MAG: HAD family hydrolase [Muricauda sp.]|nr:HAD family hydrolase [Allomuricauda sp.]MBO6531949.1 HAD family hydrolase [Allomuricauda sp.]MBO6590559.1 HAD family hydrolase [Allomuricauda sp.]MBO6620129.1 HAD family hydrolase [Allomuricauda sp.]MBO6646080.1 HAD family hydrolase [Allomuricauda sp.]MBO6748523.1 HAD family hydrolase [Allomuricauda sp.]
MDRKLIARVEGNKDINYIFCDYYDTIVHRNVHPLHTLKVWAKNLKREVGLNNSIDEIYAIRADSLKYIAEKSNIFESEVSYEIVVREVYERLINIASLDSCVAFDFFYECFLEADYDAESNVQHLNVDMINTLKHIKDLGYKIFCVSDFHFNTHLMERLLKFHGIYSIYDKICVSASYNASKENKGILYKKILKEYSINAGQVLMIGDNQISDVKFAELHGINAYHLKRRTKNIKQKLLRLRSEEKTFKKTLSSLEGELSSKKHPYSEYLILFHFFIERLYSVSRSRGIKNLFFLAREGHFLKKLFDEYQDKVAFPKNKIDTHYLKISRQGAMQISYKQLSEEKFDHLRSKYDDFSLRQFLKSFLFEEKKVIELADQIEVDPDTIIPSFFESEAYSSLLKNKLFNSLYEENRIKQKEYFDAYLAAFQVEYKDDGMCVVDVGWGGTMQECLYTYFEGKVKVEGFYLGLQEIYNITSDTPRRGLLFSVYPSKGYRDDILMANRQLYEQLLAAPHGSTLGYTSGSKYTVEYHKEEEKLIYDNFIGTLQDYMFKKYPTLLKNISSLVYDDDLVSKYIFNLKLKLDLQAGKDQISFVDNLSKGFYQNVGNNNVGLNYSVGSIGIRPFEALKLFVLRPERIYRFLVKLKPFLYNRNKYFLSVFLAPIPPFIKLNLFFRKKINPNLR